MSLVAIDTVDDIRDLGSVDPIVSFIALQHDPPPVIAEILRNLLVALARGGCIVIDGHSATRVPRGNEPGRSRQLDRKRAIE